MRTLLYFTSLILFTITFQLLGCSENTDIEITETEKVDVTLVETPSPETIFERLRNQFAGRLENQGDFIGLRNATTSRTYLDYLTEVYPTEKPVKTLEAYFQIAPPDAERYIPFLEKWIGNPIEKDIAVIHRITVINREANLILFNLFHLPERQEFGRNVGLIFEKKIGVMEEPATEAFLRRHQIQTEEFSVSLQEFVVETEKKDAIWLHEQIEVHGTDVGLLWSAIHNPALIGEVLQNFSSTDHFLKWVDVTRMQEKDG